jgi:DNA polymerase delta subunit 1
VEWGCEAHAIFNSLRAFLFGYLIPGVCFKVVGGNEDDLDELLAMEREMAAGGFDDDDDDDAVFSPMPPASSSSSSGGGGGAAAEMEEADVAVGVGWRRPAVGSRFQPHTEALAFQWMDVDLLTGEPLASHPRGAAHPVPGAAVGPVPVLRFFGVTETGNSVACFVHGFTPYLYCILPRGSSASNPALEGKCDIVKNSNESLRSR